MSSTRDPLGALLAVTVAAARMIEGAHYLHDVAAGALLGLVVTALTVIIGVRARSVTRAAQHSAVRSRSS